MNGRRIAGWTYAGAGVACAAAYQLYGWGRLTWHGFERVLWGFGPESMRDARLWYEIAPIVAISLVLAATRFASLARPSIEMCAAFSWFAAAALLGAWSPLYLPMDGISAGALDTTAGVVGIAALALCGLALSGIAAVRKAHAWSTAGQLLQALGCLALAAYLVRIGVLLFLATRIALSGGLGRVFYEMQLRAHVFLAAGLLLVGGGACGWAGRRRRLAAESVVEQRDAAGEVRARDDSRGLRS